MEFCRNAARYICLQCLPAVIENAAMTAIYLCFYTTWPL